jgi:hypothetical protein
LRPFQGTTFFLVYKSALIERKARGTTLSTRAVLHHA